MKNKQIISAAIIIAVIVIIIAVWYKYGDNIKLAAGIGGIGVAAYLAAGGTLAGYKLYQKYKAAGLVKDAATIETEAAAGITEPIAAGAVAEGSTGAAVIEQAGTATLTTEGAAAVESTLAAEGITEGAVVAGGAAVAETGLWASIVEFLPFLAAL